VRKWSLDEAGKRRDYHGVNFEQEDILHEEEV